jgi:iron(III) transport system substrate-binding protein
MKSRALARALLSFGALVAGLAQVGAHAASDRETALRNAAQYAPGLSAENVKAACNEQSVMLYTLVLHDNSREVFKQFQERFPCVTVKTFAASGGALMQRFTSEFRAKSNVADVWMNSSPLFGEALVSEKMLRNWTPPNDAAFSDQWKKQGYWYPVGLATLGVAWNTDAINAQQKAWLATLKTWDQLALAPVMNASGMVDIRAGGTTQLAYHFFEKQYGSGFWDKLAALKPSIFNGINPLVERLSAGEFPVALAITTDTAGGTQLQNGAPLEWKFPEPGLAVPYYIGVSSQAPHPDAALLLMAWSVSKDGQTAWVKSSGLAPAAKVGTDERSFAKSTWYKAPATYYRPDWPEIASEFNADVKRFDTAFKK